MNTLLNKKIELTNEELQTIESEVSSIGEQLKKLAAENSQVDQLKYRLACLNQLIETNSYWSKRSQFKFIRGDK